MQTSVHIPSRCIITLIPFAHTATECSVLVLWVQQVKEAVWVITAQTTVLDALGRNPAVDVASALLCAL